MARTSGGYFDNPKAVARELKKPKYKGIYEKFIVKRTDGRHRKGQKHYGCSYFVLDLDHDKFAIPAIRAYAEACKEEFPVLATNLLSVAGHCKPGRYTAHIMNRDKPEGERKTIEEIYSVCKDCVEN